MIAANVKRNASLIRNNVQVTELDFKTPKFSDALESQLSDIDIVICADGKIKFLYFLDDHQLTSVIDRNFSDIR